MGRGINIDFVANVGKFLGRTKDIEGALDDVADSLDDLAREGEKAGDKAGDGLKDGLKDAGTAAEKLERKFRDAFDEVKKGSRKAGDDLGGNIKRGTREAEQGLDTFKDEARQTARETAASFDGTADSAADMVQETLANALGGFGPLGAAAGIAGAAAIGTLYTAWQEKTEAMKQLVADMYADMIESGREFVSADFINQQIGEIVQDDNLVRAYSDAASKIGVSASEAIAAAAGDPAAMDKVRAAAQAFYASLGDASTSYRGDVNALVGAVDAQNEAIDTAAGRARLARDAMVTSAGALDDWRQAQAGVSDIITDTNNALLDNSEAYKDNAEVLQEKNVAALSDMATRLAEVNRAAVDANVSGADLAQVQQEQYDAFMAAARGAGLAESAARNMAAEYGLVPTDVTTDVTATGVDQARTGAQGLKRDLDALGPVSIPVGLRAPTPQEMTALQARLNQLGLGLSIPVGIKARPGVSVP